MMHFQLCGALARPGNFERIFTDKSKGHASENAQTGLVSQGVCLTDTWDPHSRKREQTPLTVLWSLYQFCGRHCVNKNNKKRANVNSQVQKTI